MCVCGGGGGGGRGWGGEEGGGTDTKTVCQTVPIEVNNKKCNYLHNVEHVVQSKFRNMLITVILNTNPTILIFNSVVSEF